MVMITFNLIVFFNVKVSMFSYLFGPFMSFFLVMVVNLFAVFLSLLFIYFFPPFFLGGGG